VEKRLGNRGKMKIGITGASGNLGSAILDKINSATKHQAFPISSFSFVEKSYFDEFDVIIHCATCYGRKEEKFSEVMSANLMVPLKILDSIKENKIFINIDSPLPKNLSPYSFTKSAFKEACQFLMNQGLDAKIINIKLHNFYGGENSNQLDLIHNFTSQLLQNKELNLTNCEQKRDFISIEDVLSAMVTILENLHSFPRKFSEVEIGSGKAISLKEIILMIKEATKSSSVINLGAISLRKNEPMELCADLMQMKKLNWQPKVSIEQGIADVISKNKQN